MLKGVLFDFDGVILDSFNDQYEWFRKICRILQKPFVYGNLEDFRRDYREPVYPAMYELLGFDWNTEQNVIWREYNEHKRNSRIRLAAGIEKVLEACAKEYALGIASSNTHEAMGKHLDAYDIRKYFSAVVGKEDLPVENEEPRLKPHPGCLLICLEKIGLKPWDCVYIGDQVSDIQAARNMRAAVGSSIPAIAVTYGYGTMQSLKAAKPDYMAETPEELLEIIKGL